MTFTNSGNSNFKNNFFYPLSMGILFILSCYLQSKYPKPTIVVDKQVSAINVKNFTLRFLSIGNKRLLSSALWIQTLLESDQEHYKKMDLNNWMYLRFLTISQLEPKFYENYLFGGIFLSILKDDLLGAADIYERGLLIYPTDYKLNYNSGFNFYYEIGDLNKGLKNFKNIENHPDLPHSIKLLINKIKFVVVKDYNIAIDFLKFQLETLGESSLKNKIQKDLYALHAMRDLECLNSKKIACSSVDYEGKRYVKINDHWHAPKKFIPYQIFRRIKK